MINITTGVCGNNNHHWSMRGEEDGCAEIDGKFYYWYGGCPSCIDIKLAKLREFDR